MSRRPEKAQQDLAQALYRFGEGPYLLYDLGAEEGESEINLVDSVKAAEDICSLLQVRWLCSVETLDTGALLLNFDTGPDGEEHNDSWELHKAAYCEVSDCLVPRATAVSLPFKKWVSYSELETWVDEHRTHLGLVWHGDAKTELMIFDGNDYQEAQVRELFQKDHAWLANWAASKRPVEPLPCLRLAADQVLESMINIRTHPEFFLYVLYNRQGQPWVIKVLHG